MRLFENNIIALFTVASLACVSCSDSFLQRNSLSESSTETFWQTSADAEMALTACYDALQDNNLYNSDQYALGPLYMDCMSDNGGHFNWAGWVPGYDVAMGTQNPSSSVFSAYWKASYEVIKRCNYLLSNISKIPNMDESERKCMIAEAITLRALIYTNLTITFQDVPYLTEVLTMETSQNGKTERKEIVKNVLEDLKACVNDLPIPGEEERGRITQGACYSIIGRLCLYNDLWDEAINAYRSVLKFNYYELYDNYTELFTQTGEKSKEIIMAVRYEGPGLGEGAGFNGHWKSPQPSMNGTLDLADSFYMKDTGLKTTDTNYGKMQNGRLVVDEPNPHHFEGRDPRLYTTLFVPGMYWNGKGGEGAWYGGGRASFSTVFVMKYFDPTDTKNSFDNGQDFYVIRYPEVLLSLAEALIKKGNYNESEVIGYINQVRRRPSVEMPKVEDVEGVGLSPEELLEVVKHERRVELAFEGLRLFDIYRWKELDKAVANIENERITLGLAYEARQFNGERDYVWPIPTSEVDTNKKLEQHPLWK